MDWVKFYKESHILKDDEFLDDEGLPRCKKCGGMRYFINIGITGNPYVV